jgi:uncharacterized protein (DUF4415 family)
MSKTTKRSAIVMPTREENRKIVAAARADPDAQPMSARQLRALVSIGAVRGRPKLESTKQLVSVRYSPEVLAYFRATGDGWQTRMDDVLRDYVARQSA